MQREPPVTRLVQEWTVEAWDALKGCFFDCTDWSAFIDSTRDVSELVDTVFSYINFCVDSVVPKKNSENVLE